MPSPIAERPGLLIRDPFQFSDVTLIIPPLLVELLEYFDGRREESDLREALYRLTGDLRSLEAAEHLWESLRKAGFLEDEVYAGLREARQKQFAESPTCKASHAGLAYPAAPQELAATMGRYLDGQPSGADHLLGIAAPHVSPEGGWQSYRAAYAGLRGDYADRVFVVLGTSHYGQAERFGLTRKAWETPWGQTLAEPDLVGELERAAPQAVVMEDYCFAIEHSIEFQIVFLQYLFGPRIRVLPILCGAFAHSIYEGGMPEDDEQVKRFIEALGEMAAREGRRLFWVLGVDMAHMGRRYGDPFRAVAHIGEMQRVEARDLSRIDRIVASDAEGYWQLVRENRDDLKWCGASPFYTFLRVMPGIKGALARYEQWNIDEASVVSFAGIHFTDRPVAE